MASLQDIKNSLLTTKVAAFTAIATTWEKVKNYLLAIVGLAALLLLGYEKIQANKIAKLQNQVDNMKTNEEAAALQTQITQAISDANAQGADATQLQNLAGQLAQKSAALTSNANNTDLANQFNQELK